MRSSSASRPVNAAVSGGSEYRTPTEESADGRLVSIMASASRTSPAGLPDHAFESLALQMGHVVVQLGSQRKQRPTGGPADHDLPQQESGQFFCRRRAQYLQHVCR